jgi:hypothetical protein
VLRALCARSTGVVDTEKLRDIEAADKAGITLALAWMTLAQHNARHGMTREKMRSEFDTRVLTLELPATIPEQIRAMIDIGTYLATTK